MSVTIPRARDGTPSLPSTFTICVSSSSEERGRIAAALDGHGLLVLVPDAQMAVNLLSRAMGHEEAVDMEPDDVVRLGPLEVDRGRATVTWDNEVVEVSHLELEVLACLAATPGMVWTYERLHEVAWGSRYVGDRDSVYSLVKRLRRKLAEAGVDLGLLAVRGIGFQLVPHPHATSLDDEPLPHWAPEAAG